MKSPQNKPSPRAWKIPSRKKKTSHSEWSPSASSEPHMRECTASSSSPSTSVGAYATLYRLHPSRCGLPFDIARCRPPSRTTHSLVSAFHHYCVGTPHTPPWEWNRSLSSMTFSSPKPVARAYQNLKAEVSTKRRVASILHVRSRSES